MVKSTVPIAIVSVLALWGGAAGRATEAARVDPITPHKIAVSACNGEIQGTKYTYRGPRFTTVRLTMADASALVSFNGVLLAPRGWQCDLTGGSDGDYLEAYNPRSGFFLSMSAIGTYEPEEAVSDYFATPGTHALVQACPFFSLAARQLKQTGLGGCATSPDPPIGERRTQVNPDEVDFADPPGIHEATGNPSGGRNSAIGTELFDLHYDKAGSATQNAATATCTLAPARRHYCAAVLRNVRGQFQASLKTR